MQKHAIAASQYLDPLPPRELSIVLPEDKLGQLTDRIQKAKIVGRSSLIRARLRPTNGPDAVRKEHHGKN
jgi:hypothetical protein